MAQHNAHEAPEYGTDRWKIARAQRAAHVEEDLDEMMTSRRILCPGDVIQYRLHPDPQWYFDTIVSTDPDRDKGFMVHCLNRHIHDEAMVGVVATKDKAGHSPW
jgi:hypothetical protein